MSEIVNVANPQIDALTGGSISIDEAHARVHCGCSFICTFTKDIPNAGTMDMLFVVADNDKLPHLTISYDCEAEISLDVYRAPTISNNGTALAIYNRNENSAVTPLTSIYHTPTVTATGTTDIFSWHAGAGKAVGASDRGSAERVMRKNTTYLFRITNMTTSDNHCAFRFDFYEHKDSRL